MVDVALLEQRAARLRDQSAKLHAADAEAGAATYRKVGQQKDEANRQLRASREAVKAAEAQAAEQHARAQDFEAQARDLEAGAKDEFNQMARISEGDLEQAQKLRALAAAASERAADNHRAVARHQDDVQRLEQQIAGLQAKIDLDGSPAEKLADQLDDMIDRMSAAAANLRQADQLATAGDHEAAEALRGQAANELRYLEQIRPAYDSVDPALLQLAGITAADRDLLDPTVLPDEAPASPSTLPGAADPAAPTSDAGARPGTDDVLVASADPVEQRLAGVERAEGSPDEVAATGGLVTEAGPIRPDPTGVDPTVAQEAGPSGAASTEPTADLTGTPTATSAAATTALRDPADLETEVGALRAQATKLHSEAARRFDQSLAESGSARDEAAAEAWALRQKAKSADLQAQREHREATEIDAMAAKYEAEAAELERAGKPLDAEEQRENADALRANARSHTQRAKDAQQRAQDAISAAEPLEQKVRDHEAEKDFDRRPQQIEHVADQVDDKVRLLQEAITARQDALRLREAGDMTKAVEAAQRAVDAQAEADALQPDYSGLEADVRAAAGIEDPDAATDPEAADATSADPSYIEMEPEVMRPSDGALPAFPGPDDGPAPAPTIPTGDTTTPVTSPSPTGNLQPASRVVGTGPDSDGDGLSDDFETNVFFSDPTGKDVDGDGLDDWAEYWLDTKPKDKDSDGDGWEDGEDLAFGDPLRHNAGGAARADLLRRAREQFEGEGSDRDHDLVRDHLEKQFGTDAAVADSDGDGLGDMVELQLRTDPLSAPGSTADLDTARARLDPRRAVSDAPPAPAEEPTGAVPEPGARDELPAPGGPALEEPTFEEPTFEEPTFEASPDDSTFAEPIAADPVPEVAEADLFDS